MYLYNIYCGLAYMYTLHILHSLPTAKLGNVCSQICTICEQTVQ